ncbi:MAG: putative peroxiredoxin [Candidatus Xenolissoclinum pacificiensis L6]|uniref:thioredoxin-dependent peroxiredoxin n=1 Tax=Candidatus Xenolissoclinum pacificiensis L6 TaxID=1401685 RepID=W2V0Z5_9RICK|nr:MAG: putative peroxiredoxin [Candidatus Xenolissoclinum pacificiensis L6]
MNVAPNFSLKSTAQQVVTLDTLLHNKLFLVLYFYPRNDTPGCTKESIDFKDYYKIFSALSTEIVGVSNDNLTSSMNFQKKYDLPFQLLSDHDQKVVKEYDVLKEKKMFNNKFLGIERSTFLISKEHNIIREWRKVRVPNHVKNILKTLEEISHV